MRLLWALMNKIRTAGAALRQSDGAGGVGQQRRVLRGGAQLADQRLLDGRHVGQHQLRRVVDQPPQQRCALCIAA